MQIDLGSHISITKLKKKKEKGALVPNNSRVQIKGKTEEKQKWGKEKPDNE